MTEQGGSERRPAERVPIGQAFLDDLFLLLALGILIPFLSYLVWGLLDLGSVPVLLAK